MPLELKPPPPPDVKAKLVVAGAPGAGKTRGATELMRGLVGPQGKFVVVNTERSGTSFLPRRDFLQYDWLPPYSPERALEILAELEREKFDGTVFDSASSIYEDAGGMQDIVERIKGGDDRKSMPAWQAVKKESKKLMHFIMECDAHIILCMRAEARIVVTREDGRQAIAQAGYQPVFDKKRMFDPHVVFMLAPERSIPTDPEPHSFQFWKDRVGLKHLPHPARLSVEYGEQIAAHLGQIAIGAPNEPLTITVVSKKKANNKWVVLGANEALNIPDSPEADGLLAGDTIVITGYEHKGRKPVDGSEKDCYAVSEWRVK